MTPENVHEPWILFEAGAISKAFKVSATPYLLGIGSKEIPLNSPLGLLQHTTATKEDTWVLVRSINDSLPEDRRLREAGLERSFEVHWPTLEAALNDISKAEVAVAVPRSQEQQLDEILSILRVQEQRALSRKGAEALLRGLMGPAVTPPPSLPPSLSLAAMLSDLESRAPHHAARALDLLVEEFPGAARADLEEKLEELWRTDPSRAKGLSSALFSMLLGGLTSRQRTT